MKTFFLFLFLTITLVSSGNNITCIYLFPGQGSDERLFRKIKFDTNFRMVCISYPLPAKGATMKEYAHIISNQIDTNQKYIFIGVSLGGMICTELADFMKPKKNVVISSAKCRMELPFRYRLQKTFH